MITMKTQTVFINFIIFLFFGFATNTLADSKKIAVAATETEKTATISKQAGRAPFFLFFDESGNFLEAVNNPARDLPGGAGQCTASFIAGKGATFIIAGHIGYKMKQALKEYHIQHREETGVAYDVVQTIIQNR